MLRLIDMTAIKTFWGHSSAGRAPAWHAGGQRFESAWLHLSFVLILSFLRPHSWKNNLRYSLSNTDYAIRLANLYMS